jgi:hypothetical protein
MKILSEKSGTGWAWRPQRTKYGRIMW